MGSAQSTEAFVEKQFARINQKRSEEMLEPLSYLVLEQLCDIEPPKDWPIDLFDIGSLYYMDINKSGKFTKEVLLSFCMAYVQFQTQGNYDDFQSRFQSYVALLLWGDISKIGGSNRFVQWFSSLITASGSMSFEDRPGITYISDDTMKLVHEILVVNFSDTVDFQTFFNLVQKVSEEQDLMTLDDKKYDHVVPLQVVETFVIYFVDGFKKLMSELGIAKITQ